MRKKVPLVGLFHFESYCPPLPDREDLIDLRDATVTKEGFLVFWRVGNIRLYGRIWRFHADRTSLNGNVGLQGANLWKRKRSMLLVVRKSDRQYHGKIPELKSLGGVRVVYSTDGVILTVYWNRDFRGLRPRQHRLITF